MLIFLPLKLMGIKIICYYTCPFMIFMDLFFAIAITPDITKAKQLIKSIRKYDIIPQTINQIGIFFSTLSFPKLFDRYRFNNPSPKKNIPKVVLKVYMLSITDCEAEIFNSELPVTIIPCFFIQSEYGNIVITPTIICHMHPM